jgi:hypothetical protein
MTLICPLLQMLYTMLIMISTRTSDPDEAFNQFITMLDDDGNPLFNVYVWDSICNDCRTLDEDAKKCPHKERERPPWLNRDNRFLRKFMSADPEAYDREIVGIVGTQMNKQLFSLTSIATLFSEKNICKSPLPASTKIIIATDPAGGGKTSMYSTLAIAFIDNKPVVSFKCFFAELGFNEVA